MFQIQHVFLNFLICQEAKSGLEIQRFTTDVIDCFYEDFK